MTNFDDKYFKNVLKMFKKLFPYGLNILNTALAKQ